MHTLFSCAMMDCNRYFGYVYFQFYLKVSGLDYLTILFSYPSSGLLISCTVNVAELVWNDNKNKYNVIITHRNKGQNDTNKTTVVEYRGNFPEYLCY